MHNYSYSEITPEILNLSKLSRQNGQIDPSLYSKYEVKRGLRDLNGKGVLAGLTDISEITSYIIEDSDMVPCDGRLYYRGYKIQDLVLKKLHIFCSLVNFQEKKNLHLLRRHLENSVLCLHISFVILS